MKIDVVNADNKKVGSLELNEQVFGGRVKGDLIHESVVRGAVPGANGGYVVIRKAIAAKPEPQPQLQEKPKKGKK